MEGIATVHLFLRRQWALMLRQGNGQIQRCRHQMVILSLYTPYNTAEETESGRLKILAMVLQHGVRAGAARHQSIPRQATSQALLGTTIQTPESELAYLC